MDAEALAAFIAEARRKYSYDVGAKETKLANGTVLIGPYTNGSLSYGDTYREVGPFSFEGDEYVREGNTAVWHRKYWGRILLPELMKKEPSRVLFAQLREALRQFPEKKPFKRGAGKDGTRRLSVR